MTSTLLAPAADAGALLPTRLRRLPEPTPEYVEQQKSRAERWWHDWREQCRADQAAYHGELKVDVSVENYKVLYSPEYTNAIRRARDQVVPSQDEPQLTVHPPARYSTDDPRPNQRAQAEANYTEQILRAAYRRIKEQADSDPITDAGQQALLTGLGLLRVYYGRAGTDDRVPAREGPGAVDLEPFPEVFEAVDPQEYYIAPHAPYTRPAWFVRSALREQGELADKYGYEPPNADPAGLWRSTEVEFLEYRDDRWWYYGVTGQALKVVEHRSTRGHGLYLINPGFGDPTGGRPEHRWVGLCTVARITGLFHAMARNQSQLDAHNAYAWVGVLASPALKGAKFTPGQWNFTSALGNLRDGDDIRRHFAVIEPPTDLWRALIGYHNFLKEALDESTISSRLTTGRIETDVAANEISARADASQRIDVARNRIERAAGLAFEHLAADLRNPDYYAEDERFGLSLPTQAGVLQELGWSRDRLTAHPRISVRIDPTTPGQKMAKLQTFVQLEGKLPTSYLYEKYTDVPDGDAMYADLLAQRLTERAIQQGALDGWQRDIWSGQVPETTTYEEWLEQQIKQQQGAGPGSPAAPTPLRGAPPRELIGYKDVAGVDPQAAHQMLVQAGLAEPGPGEGAPFAGAAAGLAATVEPQPGYGYQVPALPNSPEALLQALRARQRANEPPDVREGQPGAPNVAGLAG